MTWRMKIADWISGGELTRAKGRVLAAKACEYSEWRMKQVHMGKRDAARAALREIAHMRTPRCASIGNRMADIAEEALK